MNGFTQVTLSYQILPLGYTWLQKTIQFTDNLKSTKYVNQKYEKSESIKSKKVSRNVKEIEFGDIEINIDDDVLQIYGWFTKP